MIPTSKLLELKELSEKATQGDWCLINYDGEFLVTKIPTLNMDTEYENTIFTSSGGKTPLRDDMRFISEANPKVIKAMVEELIAAREVIGFYADKMNWDDRWMTSPDGNEDNDGDIQDIISQKDIDWHEDKNLIPLGGKCAREHQSKYGDGK